MLLPLHERIVSESQLHYNAMQLGVFDLLRTREQQMRAAVAAIETLRDYWLARTDLGQLLSGRVPRQNGITVGRREQPEMRRENAGH
jgi:cobalt-zinc-cadmium efflux system outer membrane protein